MSAQVRSLTITPTQLDLMTVPVVIDGQVRSVSFAAKHIRLLVPDALRRKDRLASDNVDGCGRVAGAKLSSGAAAADHICIIC